MKIKNKGFTLIELLVVLLVISILILLAVPKFINYMEYAKVTQIKHDTKVVENLIIAHMAKNNGELPKEISVNHIEKDELKEMMEVLEIEFYSKEGLIAKDGSISVNDGKFKSKNNISYADNVIAKENVDFDNIQYFLIDDEYKKNTVNSRLKGSFLINQNGRALYTVKPIVSDDTENPELPGEPEDELVEINIQYEYANGALTQFKPIEDRLQPNVLKLKVGETITLGAPPILNGEYILRERRFTSASSDPNYNFRTITATEEMLDTENNYTFRYRKLKNSEISRYSYVSTSEHYAHIDEFTTYFENNSEKNMYKEFMRPAYYIDPTSTTVFNSPSFKSYKINGRTVNYVKTVYLEYDTKNYEINEIKDMPNDLNKPTEGNVYMVYYLFQ